MSLPSWVLLLTRPPAPPAPTPIRVSTMTAIGDVCAPVDLVRFFREVPVDDGSDQGVVYVEMASDGDGIVWRGNRPASSILSANRRIARKKRAEKIMALMPAILVDTAPPPMPPRSFDRHFDNQVTVAFRTEDGNLLNVKLFKNGRVQLTGLKKESHGPEAVYGLKNLLAAMDVASPGVVIDPGALSIGPFRICMINSDFRLGFELRRDVLFARLRASFRTVSSFEPCIYPGVKIEYMWNAVTDNTKHDGVCRCDPDDGRRCKGKGEGDAIGGCRKVTIAVFQSGSVIITGAHTTAQIDDAYRFIVGAVASCFHDIRIVPAQPVQRFTLRPAPKKKKIIATSCASDNTPSST